MNAPNRPVILPLICLMLTVVVQADDPRWDPASIQQIDEVMLQDPTLTLPEPIVEISGAPKELWFRALGRSDAQLQRVTIDTITLAHNRGMKGLEETIPILVELLNKPDSHIEVQFSAVNALIAMDARQHAPLLAKLARVSGTRIASLVEPALAAWQSPEMLETWRSRLDDPDARPASLACAMEGLEALGTTEAASSLANLLRDDRQPVRVRIAAAKTLGKLKTTGLDELAASLAGPAGVISTRIMAVELLSQHSDEVSIGLLKTLATAESTAVQASALSRLYEIDPSLVDALAAEAIQSVDVNVRRLAALAMVESENVDRVAPLSTLLDDVNPGLRAEVAASLVHLAGSAGLRDEVIQQARGVLKRDAWRGCEQATIVLVNLDEKSVADRLIELLDHRRGEVMIASAWGLRKFGLKENLPAMLEHAKKVYRDFKSERANEYTLGPQQQVAQLFMAFGEMRYREAEELIRTYLPKDLTLGERSRAAATWAIGHLQEGKAPDDLNKLLVQRMNDVIAEEPEEAIVRYMCMISLARMNSVSEVEQIREHAAINNGDIGMAAFWSIEQLTGEPIPPFPSPKVTYDDWFLEPIAPAK